MSISAPATLAQQLDHAADRSQAVADHDFRPDFAWAAVGGVAALAACALLSVLRVSWAGSPSLTSNARVLAGGVLAGSPVVLVARSLSALTR